MLRKTLESVADAFLQQNKITARARELLTYVLQHGAAASEIDYTRPMHDEQVPADRGDNGQDSCQDQGSAHTEHAQRSDDDAPDTEGPGAPDRIDWFDEVTARIADLYLRGGVAVWAG